MHEPRIKHHGVALGYAISFTGADHSHHLHDTVYTMEEGPALKQIKELGILEPLPPHSLGPKRFA